MLINFLKDSEINQLFRSILTLNPANKTYNLLSIYYYQAISSLGDLSDVKVQLKYENYDVFITDLREAQNGALSVIFMFRKKQRLLDDILGKGNRSLVKMLKNNSSKYIRGLEFGKYFYTTTAKDPINVNGEATLEYIHDANAFNNNWKSGYEISPLLIGPDSHDKKDFVEFLFNADCYEKISNDEIQLQNGWHKSIENISKGIEEGAKRILSKIDM